MPDSNREERVIDCPPVIGDDGLIRAGGLVLGEDGGGFRLLVLDKNKLRAQARGGDLVGVDMMALVQLMAERMSRQQGRQRRGEGAAGPATEGGQLTT